MALGSSILWFILFILMPGFIFSQANNSLQEDLNRIIQAAQSKSVYRENVNWEVVSKEMRRLAAGALTIHDLTPALSYMLEQMGDEHGRVLYNNQVIGYYYSDILKEHQKSFQPDIYFDVQGTKAYLFSAQLYNSRIGYIRLVGLPMGDNQKMAKDIQDEVCRLVDEGADRWVIDLRYNGGGNMNPMVEGIAGIIGDGPAGGATGVSPEDNVQWEIRGGDFYNNGYSIRLPNECIPDSLPKVAVLTSLYTASSGEAVAVIFKGRLNTRFFGAKTLGFVTGTDQEVISDSITFFLATSFFRDRNGVVYEEYVDVDEYEVFNRNAALSADACFLKAVSWLEQE
jgi:carboxyl-terminal processing protease